MRYKARKFQTDSLEWRHNERDGVSNHRRHDGLLNRLFSRRSNETSKFRVTGLCEGNSPLTAIPCAKVSNAENVSIWWLHHGFNIASYKLSSELASHVTGTAQTYKPQMSWDIFSDRTHNLQTEASSSDTSPPPSMLHKDYPTKRQFQWRGQHGIAKQENCLKWTGTNFNTCANFEMLIPALLTIINLVTLIFFYWLAVAMKSIKSSIKYLVRSQYIGEHASNRGQQHFENKSSQRLPNTPICQHQWMPC